METKYVTELKVQKEAQRQGVHLTVIRPRGRANRYEFRKDGKVLGTFTGARNAMEFLEERR